MTGDKAEYLKSAVLIEMILKHRGKENAVQSRELERHFGISKNALREIIRQIRTLEMHPICSCSKGYYYPKTQKELSGMLADLSAKSESIRRLYACLSGCRYRLGGSEEGGEDHGSYI